MTKIGIITIHRHINPGCQLQAYGLQEAMSQFGYDAEMIDYYYPNAYHIKSHVKAKIRKIASGFIKHLLCGRDYDISNKKFNEFIQNDFHLSKQCYKTAKELEQNPPDYDLYCVGSDQVWHPTLGACMDPVFFGDFVPSEKPLVSYASSFGVTKIPPEYEDRYKRYFSRFSLFGVREQAGVELIKQLTGREAKLVVDPTLLLKAENWFQRLPPWQGQEPYILCYGCPYPNTYVEKIALHIQKQTGMKIIHLFGLPWQRFDKHIKHVFDVGPWDFLNWIKNASLVLTTSFHATIFSINFGTPFYSVYYDEEGGSRQLNILKCLQLEDRGVMAGSEVPATDFFEIDFESAHSRLDIMRENSYAYLKNMLSLCDMPQAK